MNTAFHYRKLTPIFGSLRRHKTYQNTTAGHIVVTVYKSRAQFSHEHFNSLNVENMYFEKYFLQFLSVTSWNLKCLLKEYVAVLAQKDITTLLRKIMWWIFVCKWASSWNISLVKVSRPGYNSIETTNQTYFTPGSNWLVVASTGVFNNLIVLSYPK